MTTSAIFCPNCSSPYPRDSLPWRCPICTGVYDWPVLPQYDPDQLERSAAGIWRYQHTFWLPQGSDPVTLGEGNTPLVWAEAFGRQVGLSLIFSTRVDPIKIGERRCLSPY